MPPRKRKATDGDTGCILKEIEAAIVIPDILRLVVGYHVTPAVSSAYSATCATDDRLDDLKWVQSLQPVLREIHLKLACLSESVSVAEWICTRIPEGDIHFGIDVVAEFSGRMIDLLRTHNKLSRNIMADAVACQTSNELIRKLILNGVECSATAFDWSIYFGVWQTAQFILDELHPSVVDAKSIANRYASQWISRDSACVRHLEALFGLTGPCALKEEDIKSLLEAHRKPPLRPGHERVAEVLARALRDRMK